MITFDIKKVKENLYLIIPMICPGLWALLFLIEIEFKLTQPSDFFIYYVAGRIIFYDPSFLYDNLVYFVLIKETIYDVFYFFNGYYYSPSFALLYGITISLFPYYLAYYVFYVLNYIFSILFIREYNKILILLNMKNKIYRFIFLIIIANGWRIYEIFVYNQSKFIVELILFFIIRRGLQYRQNIIDTNFKNLFIDYNLFVFAIGISPYLIFLLLIYVFQEISLSDIIKKENLVKYCIIILIFFIQNFLFILYPSLILDFIGGFNKYQFYTLFYFTEWKWVLQYILIRNLIYPSIFFIIIITALLIFNKKLKVEEKFEFFSVACIFFGIFIFESLVYIIPIAILLYAPFLNQEVKGIEIFKKNKVIFIGLLSICPIYFFTRTNVIFEYIPFLKISSYLQFLVQLRYIFLLVIFGCSLLILYRKRNKNKFEIKLESKVSKNSF